MNTSFDELHGQHILLLSRKEGGEPAASLVKEARNLLLQLRAIGRKIGDRQQRMLLVNLAVVATNRKMYDQAQSYFEEGLALTKGLGHRRLTSTILVGWGQLHLAQHNWELAAATFHQAKEVAQKVGSQEFVARALYGLAQVALGQGNIAQARQQGQESLTIFDTIGHEQATIEKEWLADVLDLAA